MQPTSSCLGSNNKLLRTSRVIRTTVTIWNEKCGKIVYELNELINIFDSFKRNLNVYNPAQIVLEQLKFEKFNENLKLLFDKKI